MCNFLIGSVSLSDVPACPSYECVSIIQATSFGVNFPNPMIGFRQQVTNSTNLLVKTKSKKMPFMATNGNKLYKPTVRRQIMPNFLIVLPNLIGE